jgi:release factor H-coupled RctB family protein
MSISIISSKKNWIESRAVDQLQKCFELPGMKAAIGMPDLHPGNGAPIGAVFACERFLYPHLVGSDIGCGMALFRTNMKKGRIRIEKCIDSLKNLDLPWNGDIDLLLQEEGMKSSQFDNSLGTIGGGNHFAELQCINEILDEEAFARLQLDASELLLLVHSGSRGLGESILRWHTARFSARGLYEDSVDADDYLWAHNHARTWARLNRKVIALRFLHLLGESGQPILDVCHNHLEKVEVGASSFWLHRKGAADSNKGPLVIPGSRGTLSYLVVPTEDQSKNLFTVAHGAGRKWSRSDCKHRLRRRYSESSLRRNKFGGRIICADKELLYEEAPQAYKDIDVVVGDLIDAGLVRPVASLAPVITFKTNAS